MNLIEILQAKGISEELIQAIQADMKANSIYTASEENLDIRYGKLKTQHDALTQQFGEAQTTIEGLKKTTKGQEEAQQKITAYETQVAQLQEKLKQTEINAAIKVGLLSEKAVDVDYLTFKLTEKLKADGEELTLDENGNIKGWQDKLAGLKTQFPTMFDAASDNGGYQVLEPNKLKKGGNGPMTVTKESFMGMSYEERMELKQKNETLYKELSK